jgi:hypothetical protein
VVTGELLLVNVFTTCHICRDRADFDLHQSLVTSH